MFHAAAKKLRIAVIERHQGAGDGKRRGAALIECRTPREEPVEGGRQFGGQVPALRIGPALATANATGSNDTGSLGGDKVRLRCQGFGEVLPAFRSIGLNALERCERAFNRIVFHYSSRE